MMQWYATLDELVGARRRLAYGIGSNRDHSIVAASAQGRLRLAPPPDFFFWLGGDIPQ